MSQTPIYEEVRRALGRPDRGVERRSFREEPSGEDARPSRPVMLRGSGGRHRRAGG